LTTFSFFLDEFFWRKKLIPHIFRQIVLIPHILFFWEKRVICTPERE